MPNLFDRFNELVPTNNQLTSEAIRTIVGDEESTEAIKRTFSILVGNIHDEIYRQYLEAEKRVGNQLLTEFFRSNPTQPFEELNRFFLSLSQSRRQKAGKSFELIIRSLFRLCRYPFDEQVVINGKPDFLMPSAEHYQRHPMDCIVFTAKRTLRERWRQIVTEGTRGYGFFLATIDKQVSEPQIQEMQRNRIYMVVPRSLKETLETYRQAPNVLTFEEFFIDHLDPAVERWRRGGIE